MLVDAQIDAQQRELFGIDFDPLDVPRDQFLVAGDAWQLCRDGKADPQAFGSPRHVRPAGSSPATSIRDVAALNNREMLPWDVWGGMTRSTPRSTSPSSTGWPPDARARRHLDELRAVYDDPRIAVPPTVFNAVLNRPEAVSPVPDSP